MCQIHVFEVCTIWTIVQCVFFLLRNISLLMTVDFLAFYYIIYVFVLLYKVFIVVINFGFSKFYDFKQYFLIQIFCSKIVYNATILSVARFIPIKTIFRIYNWDYCIYLNSTYYTFSFQSFYIFYIKVFTFLSMHILLL